MDLKVMGEFETLERVLAGASIGRLGDGELAHLRGRKNVSQIAVPALTAELKKFVVSPPKNCIVGVPALDPRSPKLANWQRLAPAFSVFMNERVKYGSAFISRPDSAPWIDVPEFYDKVQSLWCEQEVTLVANGERSLKADFLRDTGANSVAWVQCTYRDAYAQIDRIEQECVDIGRRRVLMCAGPTATVLAARLARRGLHAVDLGHIGMFWRRYANPKIKDRPEQREINIETGKVEPN